MSHAAFTLTVAGSAPGSTHFRGHVRVRFRYGLVIRNHPSDGVVDRLQSLGLPPLCYPSYEASDSCLGRSSLLNVSTFLDAQPDVQISRIRLSDRTSRLHPRRAAPKLSQAHESEVPVQVREWIAPAPTMPDVVLVA
jgi:hypothetical protein